MSAAVVTTPGANVHEFITELIVRHRSTPAEGVVMLDLAHPKTKTCRAGNRVPTSICFSTTA
jgi:hypothetical protein